MAVMAFVLNVPYANAVTTALKIGNTDSGWIAQHSSEMTVTILSIDPSTGNIEINVDGAINFGEDKESVVLKQVAADPESKFHDETFFWIRNLSLLNETDKEWSGFEIKAIDGNGRKISQSEHDDHPDAAHIHAMTPVDEGMLLSQATNGLALARNRSPFTSFTLTPHSSPCAPNCSLCVSTVTLTNGTVHKMELFNPKNIRLHIKKHESEIKVNNKTVKTYDTTMIVDLTPKPNP